MTSRWSAPGLRAFRPRSTPPPKAFRSRFSTPAPPAARPGPALGSRTTSAFQPASSGQALTARAFIQAQKFGADVVIPATVRTLDCARANGAFVVELEGGDRIQARTVVVASGARYRRPAIADIARFEGRGVWYWASQIEARLCAGEEVVLVGGGNSAGQAAVFLSAHASKVRMMVRGPGLAESMSRYLIDRIAATSNIELMTETEIVALDGRAGAGLEKVRWRDRRAGAGSEAPIRNVFLFVGADPATEWLQGCGVALDKAGFVMTGTAGATAARAVAARILHARRVCGRRRPVRIGQACRRGDRRRRPGRGGDPQFPRAFSRSPSLTRRRAARCRSPARI